MAVVHLAVAVVRLLQLQVISGLAGEIHPLPFEPFNGGLLQQRLRVHFGHKRDVLTCSDEQFVTMLVRINQDFLQHLLFYHSHSFLECYGH